jgi:hypothetical protein
MKLIKLLLLSVAIGIGAPAMAQWQWIDKDGRKVFSDRPPGMDVPEKNIVKRPKGYGALKGVQSSGTGPALRDVAPAPQDGEASDGAAAPAAPAPTAAAKAATGKDKELEAKKAADAKAKADAEAAEKAKQAAAKADNCKRAQQAKAMYDTGKAVRAPNENGEMVFQSAEQRAAEIKRTDDVIFNNC